MQSGLIDKQGNKILCLYYEIESLCIKITEEYCTRSETHNQEFLNFASDYTYFSPYFDFVVGYLDYKLINPWLKENTLLCVMQGTRKYNRKIYNSILEEYIPFESGKAKISFSSDKDLQLKKFEQKANYYKCFITEDLTEIVPKIGKHRELAKQLLNLGMIKDKELCERIIKLDVEHTDMGEILMQYWPLLRFDELRNEDCIITYRSNNIGKEQDDLLLRLQQVGKIKKEYLLNYCERKQDDLKEVKNWSNKFYSDDYNQRKENQMKM